jgi:hypothetical protein
MGELYGEEWAADEASDDENWHAFAMSRMPMSTLSAQRQRKQRMPSTHICHEGR